MPKEAYVYILFNKPFGVLYIGVTSDLIKRIYEHKNKITGGFSAKYKDLTIEQVIKEIKNYEEID